MDDSLYEQWLSFSYRHFPSKTKKVLELACGTGILSEMLQESGFEVTGFDLSAEMLDVAKRRPGNSEAKFFKGDMRKLNLGEKFDAITCYSDSICYLKDLDEVKKTVEHAHYHLNDGGVFIFDVHSIFQMDKGFEGYTFHENAEEFAFMWDTYKDTPPHSIVHELTFFLKESDGRFVRRDEVHEERTYSLSKFKEATAAFSKVEIYADFLDQEPQETSKRWFFVCQK